MFGLEVKSPLKIINTTFTGTISSNKFLSFRQCSVLFENVIFDSNNNLGTAFFYGMSSNFNMTNVSFVKNIANKFFFQLFERTSIFLKDVNISQNNFGSYIMIFSKSNIISLIDVTVEKNEVIGDASFFMIFEENELINVQNVIITKNIGDFRTLFEITYSQFYFTDSEIINMEDQKSIFRVFHSTLIFFNTTGTFKKEFNYSKTYQNQINDFIWMEKSEVTLTQLNFINASFDFLSYFIYSTQCNVTIDNIILANSGNLFNLKLSEITITNSIFINLTSNNQIIVFDKCKRNIINSSYFSNFVSESSAITIISSQIETVTTITNCKFINNTALSSLGGVIFIQDSIMIVENSVFSSNIAVRGGAIYIYSTDDKNICTFKNNQFINNQALIDGGAIKFQYTEPIDFNNTFMNNSARYGVDKSSFFSKLGFSVIFNNTRIFSSFGENSSDFFMEEVSSNVNIENYEIHFYPLNTYNEIIKESLDSQSIYITISNKFDNPSQIILEKLSEKTQEDFFYCDSKQTSPKNYLSNLS